MNFHLRLVHCPGYAIGWGHLLSPDRRRHSVSQGLNHKSYPRDTGDQRWCFSSPRGGEICNGPRSRGHGSSYRRCGLNFFVTSPLWGSYCNCFWKLNETNRFVTVLLLFVVCSLFYFAHLVLLLQLFVKRFFFQNVDLFYHDWAACIHYTSALPQFSFPLMTIRLS